MKKMTIICFAMLLILLSGCSRGKQFTGGVFYNSYLGIIDGTPREIYTFNKDGTGEYKRVGYESPFDFVWKNVDGYIMIDSSAEDSTFIYTGECLAYPMSRFDGILPNKSTFNAELVFQTYNQCLKYTFCDDGTGECEYEYEYGGEAAGKFEYTYERNGDYILLIWNGEQCGELLVSDGVVYRIYLRPYDGEHTG